MLQKLINDSNLFETASNDTNEIYQKFVSPLCYLYDFDSGIIFVTLHFRGMIYGFVSMFTGSKYEGFTFQKSLLFGSLISATDPGLFSSVVSNGFFWVSRITLESVLF